MEIDSITNTYHRILKVKDSIAALLNHEIESDEKVRINKALEELGSIQETLLDLIMLQTEKSKLKGDSLKKKYGNLN